MPNFLEPEAITSHYIRNQYSVYSEVWLLGYRESCKHANSHKQHQETTINHNYQFQHMKCIEFHWFPFVTQKLQILIFHPYFLVIAPIEHLPDN